jgi:uncharacterized protein YoxC
MAANSVIIGIGAVAHIVCNAKELIADASEDDGISIVKKLDLAKEVWISTEAGKGEYSRHALRNISGIILLREILDYVMGPTITFIAKKAYEVGGQEVKPTWTVGSFISEILKGNDWWKSINNISRLKQQRDLKTTRKVLRFVEAMHAMKFEGLNADYKGDMSEPPSQSVVTSSTASLDLTTILEKIENLEFENEEMKQRQERLEEAKERELNSIIEKIANLENAIVDKFKEEHDLFSKITQEEAANLKNFRELTAIMHSLEVSLTGLLQERITAYGNMNFAWDEQFLGTQSPREFYMEGEQSWKVMEDILENFNPEESTVLTDKLWETKQTLEEAWSKYFPSEQQLKRLVDRQKAFNEVQKKFQSFGERIAEKLATPFAIANTGGQAFYGVGTVLLTLGLTTVVTGGVVAMGGLVLMPMGIKAYHAERAEKWKLLQMNIIGHVIFLNQIKQGEDPTKSLEAYSEFNKTAKEILRQQSVEKYVSIVESKFARFRGAGYYAKERLKKSVSTSIDNVHETKEKLENEMEPAIEEWDKIPNSMMKAVVEKDGGLSIVGFTGLMAQRLCSAVCELKKEECKGGTAEL